MLPIEVIPKGRSKSDVLLYKFWRWYIKKHRKEIEKQINNWTIEYIMYGTVNGSRIIKGEIK